MEDRKEHFSLCHFIGKLVLKIAFICAVLAAIQVILAKIFHKKLEISVSLDEDDGDAASNDDADVEGEDEEPEEETENTEEE